MSNILLFGEYQYQSRHIFIDRQCSLYIGWAHCGTSQPNIFHVPPSPLKLSPKPGIHDCLKARDDNKDNETILIYVALYIKIPKR